MTDEEVGQRYTNSITKIKENAWIIVAVIFAFIYASSEICQWFLIGSCWFRWYTGAIGFSSGWGFCLSSYFGMSIIRCSIISFIFQIIWEIGQYPVGHFDQNDMFFAFAGTAIVLLLAYDFRTRRFSTLAVSEL